MASVSVMLRNILSKRNMEQIVNNAKGQLTPASSLINSYGPLTDKLTQENTLLTAKYLFDKYIKIPAIDNSADREAFRTALSGVKTSLTTSPVRGTNNAIVLLWDTTKIDDAIQKAADKTLAKIKLSYTSAEPDILQVADVGVAIAVSGTPFVGPALSGFIIGGPNVALSYEVGAMGAYFQSDITATYNYSPDNSGPVNQAGYNKAMGMAKDPGKDGMKDAAISKKLAEKTTGKLGNDDLLLAKPSSFGLGLLWYGFMRMKLGMTNSAIESAAKPGAFVWNYMSKTSIDSAAINPITRNQLAKSSRLEYVIKAPKQVGQKVTKLVQSNSKTLKEFEDKIKQSHEALREVFEKIINVGVAQSFYPELESWKKQLNAEIGQDPQYNLGDSFDNKHINVVALLIYSYFYYQEMKSRNNEEYKTFVAKLRSATRDKTGISAIDRTFDIRRNETRRQLDTLKENINISSFQSLRSNTDLEAHVWDSVKNKSIGYIDLVKNALIEDLGEPFKSNGDGKKMTEALGLYFTCVIIVTDNVSRKAAGEKANFVKNMFITTKTDFPSEAIDFLQTNGFLNKYTTTFGRVDDDEKLKQTSQGKKLRYYTGIKGASKSEKMMVYLFSLMVMIIVDPVAIVTGFQDWGRTKELLIKVIEEINKAEKEMDQLPG